MLERLLCGLTVNFYVAASAEAESGYTQVRRARAGDEIGVLCDSLVSLRHRHQVAGAEFEAPLLPQPRPGTLLGTFFWRTELLRQSVSSGVRLSATVFVHRDVWRQEGARVVGMPAKVAALTATIKSLQDLHKWIAPSMETLQQLVQQPARLTRAASQFRLSAAQVERRLRTQFSVLAADGSAAEPTDSAVAAPTSNAAGTSGGGGGGAGSGTGAGAGAGTGAGTSTSASSGKPAPPPVPPRSTIKPATGQALKGIASKRSSFSVSVSRFGGALFNMVSKGAATAMEKISQTMTVRVKAEELTKCVWGCACARALAFVVVSTTFLRLQLQPNDQRALHGTRGAARLGARRLRRHRNRAAARRRDEAGGCQACAAGIFRRRRGQVWRSDLPR